MNLGGPKPRTLLAALLLEPGRVVPIDRLIDLIWDDDPPQSAVPLVHTYVSALRRGLASIGQQAMLSTRAPGYVLDVAAEDVDIEVFTRTRAAALSDERLAAEEGLARCEMAMGQLVSAVSRHRPQPHHRQRLRADVLHRRERA